MSSEKRKIRVAVVFGGRSSEHEISCVTAGSVLSAIDHDRYEVVPVGITRDGNWVLTSGDPDQLRIDAQNKTLPSVAGESGTEVLAASLRSPQDIVDLVERGITAVTASPQVLAAMLASEASVDADGAFAAASSLQGAPEELRPAPDQT